MEGTSHFFPLVSSFISFGKIKWNGDIPRIYSCALPFSSSFSETKEEDGKVEVLHFLFFLLPFPLNFLVEIGRGAERKISIFFSLIFLGRKKSEKGNIPQKNTSHPMIFNMIKDSEIQIKLILSQKKIWMVSSLAPRCMHDIT